MNTSLKKMALSLVAICMVAGRTQCDAEKVLQPAESQAPVAHVLTEKSKNSVLDNSRLGAGLAATLPASVVIRTSLATQTGKKIAGDVVRPFYSRLRYLNNPHGIATTTAGMKALYFLSGISANSEQAIGLTLEGFIAGVAAQTVYLPYFSIPVALAGCYMLHRSRNSEAVKQ